MILKKRDEQPIRNVADWPRPKAEYHWKAGRSAYELAEAWCGADAVAMPSDIRDVLESSEQTRSFMPDCGWPEHQIAFDTHGGEPRNADLALIGAANGRKVAITIEAKADEPYGDTVGATLAAAMERAIENDRSRGVRRVEDLAKALFRKRKGQQANVTELRYQLLTAVAGTIAFARQHEADVAVLLIHEFVTTETKELNHRKNNDDYRTFLERLGDSAGAAKGILEGPFLVPGGSLFPGGASLLIGKVTTNRRV